MKVNPNMGPNFEPQDIQKSAVSETAPPSASDQIETFDTHNTTLNAGGSPVNADVATGVPILIGNRAQNFGIDFSAPDAQAASDSSAPAADDSNWLDDVGDYIKNFNIVDAGEWLGDKVVDGFLYAGEGLADGIRYSWDGIKTAGEAIGDAGEWVGEKIGEGAEYLGEKAWDGISGWASDTWDGMKLGGSELEDLGKSIGSGVADAAGDVADAVGDAASAVGDAISDVCDW
jgi:hypothetical protein